jgi:hypothetical protein
VLHCSRGSMVLAHSAMRPGRMLQRWPQPCAAIGRSWCSGRQPDCQARHPGWHVRRPQLLDHAGGLTKSLEHLAQGPHAERGSTALPRSAAHGRLGRKAQPTPCPPVTQDGGQLTEWGAAGRPTQTAPLCPHTAMWAGQVLRLCCSTHKWC